MNQTLQMSKINQQDRETALNYSIAYAAQLNQGRSETYAVNFAHMKVISDQTEEYCHWYAQAMDQVHQETETSMVTYFQATGQDPESARQAARAFADYTRPKQSSKYALPYAQARAQGHSHSYATSYATCIRQGQTEEYARGYAAAENPAPVQLEMNAQ